MLTRNFTESRLVVKIRSSADSLLDGIVIRDPTASQTRRYTRPYLWDDYNVVGQGDDAVFLVYKLSWVAVHNSLKEVPLVAPIFRGRAARVQVPTLTIQSCIWRDWAK